MVTKEALERRKYYLSGLHSPSLNISEPKKRPKTRIKTVQQRQPKTLREALLQDARARRFEPRAQAQNFVTDTRSTGGKSRRGLSRYEKNLIINHWAMRQNARYALHDSTELRTIVKRKNDSVIGNGLILDPTPDENILGIDEQTLETWANDIKSRFHLWAKSKKSDKTGTNNFYQNMRFYGWQFGRDGEVFIRLHYSDDPTLTNPVQVSFIDPNQVRGDEFTFSLGPQTQDTGIEHDENGKEIAYKVWIEDPQKPGRYKNETIPAFDEKTGLPLMLHGFIPEYVGQKRGYPEFSHGLQDFEDITSYTSSTAKKMINSTSFGFTVENQLRDPSDMGLPSLIGDGVQQVTVETPASSTSTPRTFSADSVVACDVPEATFEESGPYHILGAQQGDRLVQIKAEGPAETSAEFIDNRFMYQSASVGLPASVAKMKFDKSHSASRGELGVLAISNEIVKDDIDSDLISWVYFAWMSGEIANGRVIAPGFSNPLLRDAWLSHVLVGKPLPDVDPDKTMSAKLKALDMNLTDLDRESTLYNGSSGKANRSKMQRQVKELITDPFGLVSEKPTTDPIEPDQDDNMEDMEDGQSGN